MQAELLQEEWSEALSALFRGASKNVLIASPFVTRRGINLLVENLSESVRDGGNVQVLVNLSPQNIIQGSVDPASLRHFLMLYLLLHCITCLACMRKSTSQIRRKLS